MAIIRVGDIVRHVTVASCMTVKVEGVAGDWASYRHPHRLDGRFSTPLPDLEIVVPFLDAVRDDAGYLRVASGGRVPDFLEVPFAINLRPHTDAEYGSTINRLAVLDAHHRKATDKAAFRKAYDAELQAHANQTVQSRWRAWQDELRRRGGRPDLSDVPPPVPARQEPWPIPESERKWFFGD